MWHPLQKKKKAYFLNEEKDTIESVFLECILTYFQKVNTRDMVTLWTEQTTLKIHVYEKIRKIVNEGNKVKLWNKSD